MNLCVRFLSIWVWDCPVSGCCRPVAEHEGEDRIDLLVARSHSRKPEGDPDSSTAHLGGCKSGSRVVTGILFYDGFGGLELFIYYIRRYAPRGVGFLAYCAHHVYRGGVIGSAYIIRQWWSGLLELNASATARVMTFLIYIFHIWLFEGIDRRMRVAVPEA